MGQKGQFENLTSGRGHDLIKKGNIAYQSIRMVALNPAMMFSLL